MVLQEITNRNLQTNYLKINKLKEIKSILDIKSFFVLFCIQIYFIVSIIG